MMTLPLQEHETARSPDVMYDIYTESKGAEAEGTADWSQAPIAYVSSASHLRHQKTALSISIPGSAS